MMIGPTTFMFETLCIYIQLTTDFVDSITPARLPQLCGLKCSRVHKQTENLPALHVRQGLKFYAPRLCNLVTQ